MTAPSPTDPPGATRPWPVALAVVAVVAGIAAVWSASTGTQGAASPSGAVDRTLAAVVDADAFDLLGSLAPEERAALAPELPATVEHLERLGLLDDLDPADVRGVTLRLDAPRYAVLQADDDTAVVEVTSGRLTATGSDGLPLTGRADASLRRAFGWDVLGEAARDFAQEPLRVVAVRRGGGWYTSLIGTWLDAAAGAPPAEQTPAVEPIGADDPAAAVRTMLEAWAGGDPAAALAVLDPTEAGPVYRWSSSVLAQAPPVEAEVVAFDATTEGRGDRRTVTVADLEVLRTGTIDQQRTRYDGECFTVERRFAAADEPWVTFRTCDGDPPTPHPDEVVNAERLSRGGESLPTGPTGLDPGFDLSEGVRLGPEALDRGILERQAAAARRRPHDDPVSALAHFGGGADLPTFVVIERDGRWYVQPLSSLARSVVDTLAATDEHDADLLAARVEQALRPELPTRVVLESRDPDNVLYGSATAETSPLVAECFRTVLTLAGDQAMVTAGTACVRHLEATGRLDGQPVPALLGAADCLMVGPSSPPSADDPLRRFYLVAVARRACIVDRVTAGSLPAGSLDVVEDPTGVACWEPYTALAPTDPEDAWAAADVAVAACKGIAPG